MPEPLTFAALDGDDPIIDRSASFVDLSDDEFVRRFLEPTMWRVLDFPETAWWGHLPFMFAIVDLVRPRRFVELGAHHGTSFFAANQAAQRLGFSMEALAVDSWEGEQHTGEYDDSVYVGFTEVLEHRRYTNAQPLKMYFDEAVKLFEDESVDLLHIDGLHTYEAVKHDYESWIDKVVPGGLILFHDINVHQKDFGVWRLWNALLESASPDRSFSFAHSHGLGVLQKPGDGFPHVSRLLRILGQNADLASFVQLITASVSELGHLASKLEPTQKAASIHRDARHVAEQERRDLRDQLNHARRQAENLLADKRNLIDDRRVSGRVAEIEKVLATLQGELRDAEKAVAASSGRLKREVDAGQNLRSRNQKLKGDLAKERLRTRLAVARGRAAQDRLRSQMSRALEIAQIQSSGRPTAPSSLDRVVMKARGESRPPTTGLDPVEITKQVREEVFVEELAGSGLFDEDFYLETYPDAVSYVGGPLLHFVRHGRHEDRQPNSFFDPAVYRSLNADVAQSGIEATEHYLHFGAFELRSIGAEFDSPGYLLAHSDDMKPTDNALGHFLRVGRGAGYSPLPLPVDPATSTRRRKGIDREVDRKTTTALLESYASKKERIDDTLVSIVMPSYNRADLLPRAVDSVLGQTHQHWELIIVDDGSTDSTPAVVDRLSRDPRVRVIWNEHLGVSGARNVGLEAANGELIAFLDTDNEWTPDYLRLMLTHFADSASETAYSAMAVLDDRGKVTSYLSSEFDWDTCYDGNYVDMNVFMHRRDLVDANGNPFRFETELKRMVDWDYILRITRTNPPSHVPFMGCRYFDSSTQDDRISKSEPMIYRKLVRARNDPKVDAPPTFAELAEDLELEFAIRISAPWSKRHVWGDSHYAEGLRAAIEGLGHRARIVYHDDDDKLAKGAIDEVNLVLRGLTPHGPIPNAFNILWVISHPEKVSTTEMAGYNLVYVASESHAALLQHDPKAKPRTLMQATAFEPVADPLDGGVVFVGNSRNVERPIVGWAAAEGLDLRLFGNGWQDTSVAEQVLATSFPNERLPALYGGADVVLNDHWQSMREFGYISNRIFDVLAAGGTVVSDPMPAIDRFFGASVHQVTGPTELSAAVGAERDPAMEDVARAVRADHSFGARAEQLVNDIFGYLNLDQPYDEAIGGSSPWGVEASAAPLRAPIAVTGVESPKPLAIGALFMGNKVGYQSSAYIRVLSPLTTDENFSKARVIASSRIDAIDVESLDAVIVGRTALDDVHSARTLVERAHDANTVLLVDVDDSFGSLQPGTVDYDLYQPRLAALRYVIDHADAVTMSTSGIADAFGVDHSSGHVVENTLDPRLWRRYPRPDQLQPRDPNSMLRIVYMGTATHDEDFEMVVDALDEWAENEEFELTIIGAVRNPPDRTWLRRLDVPNGLGLYPRFAHWLLDEPRFDIGLAPLQDNAFNAGKSDIKFLDYCAIGAIPVLSDVTAYGGDSHIDGLAYHATVEPGSWLDALTAAAEEVRYGARTVERQEWLWSNRNATTAGQQLIDLIEGLRSK